MMINVGVNVKNRLIKVYVIEDDRFEILVTVSVNAISSDIGEYLEYKD